MQSLPVEQALDLIRQIGYDAGTLLHARVGRASPPNSTVSRPRIRDSRNEIRAAAMLAHDIGPRIRQCCKPCSGVRMASGINRELRWRPAWLSGPVWPKRTGFASP
jgi:hypothetical protein